MSQGGNHGGQGRGAGSRADEAFVDVGIRADEIAEGALRAVDVGEEHLVIARNKGKLHALGGVCTHQVAFLEDGCLHKDTLLCPRHGAAFDLETGEALTFPAVFPVPVFDVRLEDGRILVGRTPRPVVPAASGVDISVRSNTGDLF
ncbi:MAG TPA: Rieske 2Fe-2S domain-containing protein, partial [Polyangia bacterium]